MDNPGVAVDELVIRNAFARDLAVDYLSDRPEVVEALRRTRARVMIFDCREFWNHDRFFVDVQRILDEVEATIDGTTVYVACVPLTVLVATRAFEWGARDRIGFVDVASRRGVFLGYLAFGEGGVLFFNAKGKQVPGRAPATEDVVAALNGIK